MSCTSGLWWQRGELSYHSNSDWLFATRYISTAPRFRFFVLTFLPVQHPTINETYSVADRHSSDRFWFDLYQGIHNCVHLSVSGTQAHVKSVAWSAFDPCYSCSCGSAVDLGWSLPCTAYSLTFFPVKFYTGIALYRNHNNLEHLAMMKMTMGRVPDRSEDPWLSL